MNDIAEQKYIRIKLEEYDQVENVRIYDIKERNDFEEKLEGAENYEGPVILNCFDYRAKEEDVFFPETYINRFLKMHHKKQNSFFLVIKRDSNLEQLLQQQSLLHTLNIYNSEEDVFNFHLEPFHPRFALEKEEDHYSLSLFGTLIEGIENLVMQIKLTLQEPHMPLFVNLQNCYSIRKVAAEALFKRLLEFENRLYFIYSPNIGELTPEQENELGYEFLEEASLVFNIPQNLLYIDKEKAKDAENLIKQEKHFHSFKRQSFYEEYIIRGVITSEGCEKIFKAIRRHSTQKVLAINLSNVHEIKADCLTTFKAELEAIREEKTIYIISLLPVYPRLTNVIYTLYKRKFLILPSIKSIQNAEIAQFPGLVVDKSKRYPTLVIKGNKISQREFQSALQALGNNESLIFFDLSFLPCPVNRILYWVLHHPITHNQFKVIICDKHVKELIHVYIYKKIMEGFKGIEDQINEEDLDYFRLLQEPLYRKENKLEINSLRKKLHYLKTKLQKKSYQKSAQDAIQALDNILISEGKSQVLEQFVKRLLFIFSTEEQQFLENIKGRLKYLFDIKFKGFYLSIDTIESTHLLSLKPIEKEYDLVVSSDNENLKIYEKYYKKGGKILGLTDLEQHIAYTSQNKSDMVLIPKIMGEKFISYKIIEFLAIGYLVEKFFFSKVSWETLIKKHVKNPPQLLLQMLKAFFPEDINTFLIILSKNPQEKITEKYEFLVFGSWEPTITLDVKDGYIEVLRRLPDDKDCIMLELKNIEDNFALPIQSSKRFLQYLQTHLLGNSVFVYSMKSSSIAATLFKNSSYEIQCIFFAIKHIECFYYRELSGFIGFLEKHIGKDPFLKKIPRNLLLTIVFICSKANKFQKKNSTYNVFIQPWNLEATFVVENYSEDTCFEQEISEYLKQKNIPTAVSKGKNILEIKFRLGYLITVTPPDEPTE